MSITKLTATIQAAAGYSVTSSGSSAGTSSETVNLGSSGVALALGTLANQIGFAVSAAGTLTATSTTFDLMAFPSPTGNITFTKVKLIYVENNATADGAQLWLGNAASNPFSAFTDTAAAKLAIMPGSSLLIGNYGLQGVNPWTVDASHHLLKLDSGAATIPYKILVLGI